MNFNIAVAAGDGIGPEVINETRAVLDAIGKKYGHSFNYTDVLAGGVSIDKHGEPLTQEAIDVCLKSDSVLLGAVGGYKWDTLPGHLRPEMALLGLRKALGLYANIRPAVLYKPLKAASPLRADIVGDGIDFVVVRELTGGMYFGEKGRKQTDMGEAAWDTEIYSYNEVKRIATVAFEMARLRGKKLTSVDKANVMESSRLWREVVLEVAKDYPDIALDHMYVDNASMQLIRDPHHFDVIVTNNVFGDILSDEASQITGSIGLLPSASLSGGSLGMYEPIHGSAPDIAGKGIANPIATILSSAMMLRYSFKLAAEARDIETAVSTVLENGYRTGDIMSEGMKAVGTKEMGALIKEAIEKN